MIDNLKRARCHGKIRRDRSAGHISIAQAVHGNGGGVILASAAEVGRVHQRRACRVQLGHKGVPRTEAEGAVVDSLKRTRRDGKTRRLRKAGHIGVA